MRKINPYYIIKKAGISPALSTTAAAGTGMGIGYLLDALDLLKGTKVENPWRRPVLGVALASLPFLGYGAARNSWDRTKDGDRSMSFLERWLSDDDTFWSKKTPNEAYNRWADQQRTYYTDDSQRAYHKTASYIPVNSFNQVTWTDAASGRTPLEAAGFVTNTLNQTRRNVGSSLVTPGQVINNMVNAGIGYGTAWLAGKTLGALAGVSPATQQKLCDMGAWGGMLSGISNAANMR